ncbi:hypothetical protein RCH05_000507 [Janthinobacterium sp. CAN_S7]
MIGSMLQQPSNPMEYAMHKPEQSMHVNKPLLLICLFTFAILAATLLSPGDAPESAAAPAAVARDAGQAGLPVCSSFAHELTRQCQVKLQPQPGRQA